MTLLQLKEFLETLTDEQLQQQFVVFQGDEEQGFKIDYPETQREDLFWYEGDYQGGLEQVQHMMKEDSALTMDDFLKVPKGTVSFHSEA